MMQIPPTKRNHCDVCGNIHDFEVRQTEALEKIADQLQRILDEIEGDE